MAISTERIDPRVQRTRGLIQQAFQALMREQGFESITIQSITERATVNRSTFYAHFTDKYDLMDTLMREQVRDVLRRTLPDDAPVNRAHLHALTRAICEYLMNFQSARCQAAGHDQCEPLIEAAVQAELHSFIEAWFKRLPGPTTPPDVSVAMAASIASWTIFGAGLHWRNAAQRCSLDDLSWQVVAALTKGVPAAMGQPGRLA